jgi:hypothetical protein
LLAAAEALPVRLIEALPGALLSPLQPADQSVAEPAFAVPATVDGDVAGSFSTLWSGVGSFDAVDVKLAPKLLPEEKLLTFGVDIGEFGTKSGGAATLVMLDQPPFVEIGDAVRTVVEAAG